MKMEKTIVTKFDPTTLPRWAQADANVLEICKTDLAFRADVCSAVGVGAVQLRKVLKREAEARMYIKRN